MSLGMGIGVLAVFVILYLAIIIFMIASLWKIFSKAGQPGWACIVPIYNVIVLLNVAGKPWWWILLMCIPIVNFVILIMVYHGISVNFGKDAGFTVGLILLPFIFIPILGFGKAQYIGAGVPQN